jgi:hypothetical protein
LHDAGDGVRELSADFEYSLQTTNTVKGYQLYSMKGTL